jgi:hypothetical protein
MNASALLAKLTRSGIHLEPRGDRLHVEDPGGVVTPELRQSMTTHKAALMAELRDEPKALPQGVARAYKRLCRTLAEHPTLKTAVEVLDPDAEPVLLAVAVRGCGYVTLRMPRANYDEGRLLELTYRWNKAGGGH